MKESKFKAIFTLKQHTPIIHFQSEQSGATLRATELKPKFDSFLKQYAFDGEVPREYLIDKDKDALDYKVKIISSQLETKRIEKRNHKGKDINNPLFFGNMKPKNMSSDEFEKIRKKFQIHKTTFDIEFFTFNTQLKSIIEEQFESFLANTNFGTRQSKGFGSFYVADSNFNKKLIKHKLYSFTTKNWEKDIGLLYQFLRQGINLPNRDDSTRFYSKPAIFSYAKSMDWQWDKKSIKEKYFSSALEEQIEKHHSDILMYSTENRYLLRDLFGLSSSQEWKSYNRTIEKENSDIERFKSPITFKVIDNIVYFWADNSVENILDTTFKIKAGNRQDLELSTPSEFSFDDFFAFTFKIDLSQHIEPKYHSQSEHKTLVKIFNNVKASL